LFTEGLRLFWDSLDYTTKQQKKTKAAPAMTLSQDKHRFTQRGEAAAKGKPRINANRHEWEHEELEFAAANAPQHLCLFVSIRG
jgi:hypothetical protein